MVDTISVDSVESFVDELRTCDANTLDEAGSENLYEFWSDITGGITTPNEKLIVVEDWLTCEKLGRRRPFLLGTVEYDDSSKGAVLFSNLRTIDVSIFENHVLEDFLEMESERTPEDVLEPVDISPDSDYVDDPGLLWIPRSEMTVYEHE